MADTNLSGFIWSVADLLRGDFKQSEYGRVILPFTVLRRLDCVLEPTKDAVLKEHAKQTKAGRSPEPFVLKASGQHFYNTSPLDMKKLVGDQDNIGENLRSYIDGFAPAVRDIFESFEFHTQIDRLAKAELLYLVTEEFAQIDLHPDRISNEDMGAVFEELIRKFAELSNETAGEHFTPREVIKLMVDLLFTEDTGELTKPGVVRTIDDPTAGTGGMLSVAGDHLTSMNPKASLVMHGQELNPESYAICKADMLIKGQDVSNIVFGNTLSDDEHPHLQPITESGGGEVRDTIKATLDEILEQVNELFEGELTDDDKLVYVNNVLKGKLLESDVLRQQAVNNSKQQFANSPDLQGEILKAVMEALDAHGSMSSQALDSSEVRDGLRRILLGPGKLYESLRQDAVDSIAGTRRADHVHGMTITMSNYRERFVPVSVAFGHRHIQDRRPL